MRKEEFFDALDKGLFNLTALAKMIGITNPTMYSKATSKKFKQWEIDKLIDAGLIVPDNLLKDWGDYVRDEFMSNKTTELSDDTIYNLEFDKLENRRTTTMKQKYLIINDKKNKKFKIQEFAELNKEKLSLLCEEG